MSRPTLGHIEEEDFDIMSVLREFSKRWYWYALTIPLFILAACWHNYNAVPLYSIKAKILVEDDKGRVIYTDDAMRGMDHLFRTKTVSNEIQLLKSRDMIATALDSLHLNVSFFDVDDPTLEYYSADLPIEVWADFKAVQPLAGKEFQIAFVNNDSFTLDVNGESLGQFSPGQIITYEDIPIIIQKSDIENKKRESIPPMKFYINSDEDQRGQDVVNSVIRTYFFNVLDDRRRIAENAFDFIDGRLKKNYAHLDSVETAIDGFKRQRSITDPLAESRFILEGIKSFEVELSDAKTQLKIIRQIFQKASRDTVGELDLSIPKTMLGVADPLLDQLLKSLNLKQSELKRLSETVNTDNPLYKGRLNELNELQTAVINNLSSLENNLEVSVADITAQIADYKAQLSKLSYDELGLTAMERVRDNEEQLYVYLLQKREEAAMVLASELMDTWVLETPYVADFFYSTKRGLPILGRIAHMSKKRKKEGKIDRGSIESLKRLLINIKFIKEDYKVVLVDSMRTEEGKSFSAMNLAIASSSMGKKTCLLELDLRRPSLASKFGVETEKTVTDYLSGSASPNEIMHREESYPGLDVIYSSEFPIDPSNLLLGHRLDALIGTLKRTHDTVIIDTPPIGAVSDAMVLSKFADVHLLVVRNGVTSKDDLVQLREQLNAHGVENGVALFNGISPKKLATEYLVKEPKKKVALRGFKESIGPLNNKKGDGIGESSQGK